VKKYSTDLSPAQWQRIEKLIEVKRKSKWPLQKIVEGIFYLTKNGCVWRDLPSDFPSWQTVYWYFQKWVKSGVFELISAAMTLDYRILHEKQALPSAVIVDSQSVKNSAWATQSVGIDGGKLIKGRKRFVLCDTLGNLLNASVVSANCHDGVTAAQLWEYWSLNQPLLDKVNLVFADGTFGGTFKRHLEASCGVNVEIPKGAIAKKGNVSITAFRWIVERTLAWITNNRRLARDFERKTATSEAFLNIAHIRRVINHIPTD
jgi:putative transposase